MIRIAKPAYALTLMLLCVSAFCDAERRITVTGWQTESLPEVIDDAGNLSISSCFGQPTAEKQPPLLQKYFKKRTFSSRCQAAAIKDKSNKIEWKPKWYFAGIGGVRLPDISFSSDGTVMAIAEVFGEAKGPFGSRIVFFSTYSWQPIRVITFKNKKLKLIRFLPDSTEMICWFDRQVNLKQSYELAILDCCNGQVMAAKANMKSDINDMLCSRDGQLLYVAMRKSPEVHCFKLPDLSPGEKAFKVNAIPLKLALNKSGDKLAVASKREVTIFDVAEPLAKQVVKLDPFEFGKQMFFVDNSNVMLLSKNGTALVIRNGRYREFVSQLAPLGFVCDEANIFGLMKQRKNVVTVFEQKRFAEQFKCYPVKLKPKTRFEPVFMSYIMPYKGVLLLDAGGNLYLVFKRGKRWKKFVVFSAYR